MSSTDIAGSSVHNTRSTLSLFVTLPVKVRALIATFGHVRTAHSLARLCKRLQSIGESRVWRDIRLCAWLPSDASMGIEEDERGRVDSAAIATSHLNHIIEKTLLRLILFTIERAPLKQESIHSLDINSTVKSLPPLTILLIRQELRS